MESFTMSVDRGFLGRTPGDRDPGQYRSMDDLAVQKTTGLELVRLLRVKNMQELGGWSFNETHAIVLFNKFK